MYSQYVPDCHLADNPRQEINMGTSTFSGPIKAGPIKFTTGTTLGQDVANTGNVVLMQSEAVTQAGPGADGVYTTNIVLPAGSTITDIKLYVGVIWSGVASTVGIGTTASATALTAASAVAGGTLGIITATAGADATRIGNWYNVGTTDIRIKLTSTNTGTGTGYLVVSYVQPGVINP
jgi:hypothetical protein